MSQPHMLATVYLNKAYLKKDAAKIKQWLIDLVDIIDMKILIQPKVVWCSTPENEGLTGIVCIDTSHASVHFWDGYMKFDLYSCKDFDVDIVLSHLNKLNTHRVDWTLLDRSNDNDLKKLTKKKSWLKLSYKRINEYINKHRNNI